ncbi:MAG: hypothetical protein AB7E80_16695 [Hyphomicrobiaceae bacterium]
MLVKRLAATLAVLGLGVAMSYFYVPAEKRDEIAAASASVTQRATAAITGLAEATRVSAPVAKPSNPHPVTTIDRAPATETLIVPARHDEAAASLPAAAASPPATAHAPPPVATPSGLTVLVAPMTAATAGIPPSGHQPEIVPPSRKLPAASMELTDTDPEAAPVDAAAPVEPKRTYRAVQRKPAKPLQRRTESMFLHPLGQR